MTDDRVAAILAEMAKDDPDAATLAGGVYDWVAGEGGVETITLAEVQRFAWYDVSVKWLIEDSERWDVLAAGATLLDMLGLDRYASVLRSPQTAEIVTAHERSHDEGLRAFRKAFAESGIAAPDLEDFAWGDRSAIEEASAHDVVMRYLELAMDDGSMTLGSRGWRTTAKAITKETLDSPHPEIPGQSWRSVILTERAHSWLRMLEGRSKNLHSMLSNTVNLLLSPVPAPPGFEQHLESVIWFLEYVGDGVKMTGAGYIPTAMVREAADRFGWNKGWSDDPPQKESDSRELMTIHELLLDAGAVRHRKGVVKRTTVGSRMLDDPEYMWRTLTATFIHDGWLASVTQAYTLLLLDGESDTETLCDRARAILIEFGYRSGDGGPPERLDVMSAWWRVTNPLEILGGLTETGRRPARRYELSPFGEATLLERLRLDITGPSRYS